MVTAVDDHPVVPAGMRRALNAAAEPSCVAGGDGGAEVLRLGDRHRPDVRQLIKLHVPFVPAARIALPELISAVGIVLMFWGGSILQNGRPSYGRRSRLPLLSSPDHDKRRYAASSSKPSKAGMEDLVPEGEMALKRVAAWDVHRE